MHARKQFRIVAEGQDLGLYWGKDENEALELYAKDAGYSSFEALARCLNMALAEARGELELVEVKS